MNLPANKKETALRAIASNKRYTAGLHVAAGRFLLGPEVVNDQLKRKRYTEEVQSEQENKKIDAHMALANKVYAIRSLNKQPAEWTVAQTKTMAMWYKQSGNLPLPTTKQLLLTRFHDTMMRGDAAAPVATAVTAPLPQHPLVAPIT